MRHGMGWPRRIARAIGIALAIVAAAVLAVAAFVSGPRTSSRSVPVPEVSEERLRETVHFLSEEIGARWYQNVANLDRAAAWIGDELRDAGLEVEEQQYRLREGTYRNVIGTRAGSEPEPGVIVLGAHYDAYGEMPGADDNASGVAALLEVARTLPASPRRRTLHLVAFTNEEPPFFGSDEMGSARYAERLVEQKTPVHLMIALDLIGYYRDEPESQDFPLPALRLLYPSTGNFVAVVGDTGAGRWIKIVKRGMRSAGTIPVESFRAPSWVPGVDFSDHLSFRNRKLPGVLVTDTAFLRNPNYHRSSDTADTLDYRRLAAVTRALHGALLAADED